MALSHDAATHQQTLLNTYRRNAGQLARQVASYGTNAVPVHIEGSLEEARVEIARIKTILRQGGYSVPDEPNDEATIALLPSLSALPSRGQRVRVTFEVMITNPELLRVYAARVYADAHDGSHISTQYGKNVPTPAQVLEAVVLSNENPNPDTYGIEITAWKAEDV